MKKLTLLLGVFLMVCASLFAQAPANCPDVMLQGFHWDSYGGGKMDKSYSRTKWSDLTSQANEIAETFTMVWLPPSAKSSGGTGYHPKEWSNQNGDWGSKTQLKALIDALHAKNCKVIADIVINHRDGNYNWADFCNENFGTYGSFTLYPSAQFICKDDECTKNGHSATGNKDAGYDYNCEASGGYCASRDLDHSNTTIQKAIKAYLKWMKAEMGYDGWRYDLVKGYLGKYTKMYNEAGGAYYSVGEYWDGNYDAVKNWINETGKTSTAFDFPNKYATFNNGLASKNFGAMINGYKVPNGLCGADEMKRYATTFIDNHDTFRDGSKYGGDWTTANAVLLSQPGIPCVFYPHWEKCKNDIKKMVATRKAMGIHSQSACTTAGGGSYYQSTTIGTKGTLICFIGSGWSAPAGYTKACGGTSQGTEWAYYTSSQVIVPDTPVGPVDPDTPVASQSYAIRVNGTTNYPAEHKGPSSVDPSYDEYMASVQLKAGDTFVTYDLVNNAGWVMEIEPYGEYANFEVGTSSVKCTKDGCYDFYIKMKFQADIMYIGEGTNCGSAPLPDDPQPDDPKPVDPKPVNPTIGEGYYVCVNGTDFYVATPQGEKDMQGRDQYMASVPLKAGDKFKCYNGATGDAWSIVALEPYGEYANFTAAATYADDMVCNVDGCYDLYIKLMYEDDTMYIGAGTDCSAAPIRPDASAIIEAETVNMVIYPNPTSDYITISCDEAIEEVVINAINGSEVIRTNSNEIDLSALNPSMYFVNIMLQNGDVVRSKVIRK